MPLILFLALTILIMILSGTASTSVSADIDLAPEPGENDVLISQIAPDKRGGKAYKLIYFVQAPIDGYWKIRTDYDNTFVKENKYIKNHRFISQVGNEVITEDKYTNGPDVFFRWRTTVLRDSYHLDFILLNPEQCDQKFHYGSIQLEAVNEQTRVTQVAYFDLVGPCFE
jgi:hypothetical protein